MQILDPSQLAQGSGGKTLFNNDGLDPDGRVTSTTGAFAGSAPVSGVDGVGMQTVVVTGSLAEAAQLCAGLASYNEMSAFIAAAVSLGAGVAVTGARVAIPAFSSGPAAAETVATLMRPCAYFGGLAATATGIHVGNVM